MLIALAPVFGVLAGVVGVVDTVPYVRDIVRGTTRPHRGTWFIWGMLAIVVCVSQRADGASWSLVMAGTQAVLTTFIFVLAIRRGEDSLSATDGLLIAIAAGGMAAWIVVDEPLIATACVIGADLIAAAMMVPKVHRDPDSETLVSQRQRSIFTRTMRTDYQGVLEWGGRLRSGYESPERSRRS